MALSEYSKRLLGAYAEQPFLMAPMAGVTDPAYRIMCRRRGANLAYSEMVSVAVLADASNKTGLGGMKMPLRYVCEMVCDRVAASQIYLGDKYTDASPWEYYERSKTHYLLHPETRALLEELLKMVRDLGHDRTFEHMKYLLGCEKDY